MNQAIMVSARPVSASMLLAVLADGKNCLSDVRRAWVRVHTIFLRTNKHMYQLYMCTVHVLQNCKCSFDYPICVHCFFVGACILWCSESD